MKPQKEKIDKTRKAKPSLKAMFYLFWCDQSHDPSILWYKVNKWMAYIVGIGLILSGIIFCIGDILYEMFTPEKLSGYIVLILLGLLLGLSDQRRFIIKMYSDEKIEEWERQEKEQKRLKKQKKNNK